ncbi:outer membrane beta-barrel family protein [Sphingomonas mesophila]|uniref:outer membrane beta-barrel family protein n=1 Tax=Sphingomonas mesophila TaxID=2303576 RepID=UPI0013C2B1C6|nr:outer membrane beta-barrel family protein [Sphingomonas mesophila]
MKASLLTSACSLLLLSLPAAPALAQQRPAARQTPPAKPEAKAEEVVVTGTRADVIAKPDRLSFSIANDLQAQTGTLADALRNVPGVEVDLQGRVSLRGDPGVQILIDGRPSAVLQGESRADYLQSTPATRIERVEVITNPSAAFSPEGSGGIINLVTKKNQAGSRWATLRAIGGLNGQVGANASGAITKGGLTVSGELGARRFPNDGRVERTRQGVNALTGLTEVVRQSAETDNVFTATSGRLGVEYDLTKTSRLSGDISLRRFWIDGERDDTILGPNPGDLLERTSDSGGGGRMVSFEGSWRKKLPGDDHELVADIEIDRMRFDRDFDGISRPGGASGAPTFERIGNRFDRRGLGGKVDYKRPLGKGSSLNLGYELASERSDFSFDGERGPALDLLLPIAGLNNDFSYDQTVHALYATTTFSLGKLELQPGLRLEQAQYEIDPKTPDGAVENEYVRLYPTIHLGYALSETQRLRASYSRRIQRPGAQDLNPYLTYVDPQNFRRGNPFLGPEVTDAFELGWTYRKGGGFYSMTAFYRSSRDGVTDIIDELGDGILLTTRANLARSKRYGVEAIANGKFGKTLGYNLSATLFHHEIEPAGLSFPVGRSGTSGNARASFNWQPTTKDFFQLGAIYSGRQLLPQGYRDGGGVVNAGYRRKINDRLSLLATAQDLLSSARSVTKVDTNGFREKIVTEGPGRTLLFGLTYNLGAGGRRRPDQGIEFESGGSPIPQ